MRFVTASVSILTIIVLFTNIPNSYASKPCGEITHITGKVEVLRAQNNQDLNRIAIPVKTPFQLLCTDVLVTQAGSRAKVKLENGLITLSPNSRISIAKVVKGSQAPSLLNLTYGKLRTFFDGKKAEAEDKGKNPNETRFKVKTQSAVVGVRGTDFYVGYDPNKDLTTQATLKGEVEVEQLRTTNKVYVKEGEQVEVPSIDKLVKAQVSEADKKAETLAPVLEVKPINKETILQIRQTSPLVKEDVEFKSKEAIAILGEPERWTPPKDEIPGDLKDIKNEF